MKKWMICGLLAAASLIAEEVRSPILSVAVMGISDQGEAVKPGEAATYLLESELGKKGDFLLVERQELEKILGEQELGLSGTVSQASAAKIGYLTGAKILITGKALSVSGQPTVFAKVMSTETGRVFAHQVSLGSGGMAPAMKDLATQIRQTIHNHEADLVPIVEDPGAQIARLKKLIQGRSLPSVRISISEKDARTPLPDPAVETEIKLGLKQLGFRVVSGDAVADVMISGEAFSETAGRRGNLVSARARTEVEVKPSGRPVILLADRQSEVAVDLSESVAGKAALGECGRRLLDRIVPALLKPAD
jgi:hypothetical protein